MTVDNATFDPVTKAFTHSHGHVHEGGLEHQHEHTHERSELVAWTPQNLQLHIFDRHQHLHERE